MPYFQPIKRKKEGEEKRMTQEEMLKEAAQTGRELSELVEIYQILYSHWDCHVKLYFMKNFRNYEP